MQFSNSALEIDYLGNALGALSERIRSALPAPFNPVLYRYKIPAVLFAASYVPIEEGGRKDVFLLDLTFSPDVGSLGASNTRLKSALEARIAKLPEDLRTLPKLGSYEKCSLLGWNLLKVERSPGEGLEPVEVDFDMPKDSVVLKRASAAPAAQGKTRFFLKRPEHRVLPREKGMERLKDNSKVTRFVRETRGSIWHRPFMAPMYAATIDASLAGQNAILTSLFLFDPDEGRYSHLGGAWIAAPRLNVSCSPDATIGPLMPY